MSKDQLDEEIGVLLSRARSEGSHERCLSLLRQAQICARRWVESEDGAHAYELFVAVLAELAQNISSPKERAAHWEQALSAANTGWGKTHNYQLAFELGAKTVDYVEDEFALKTPGEVRGAIKRAKSVLDDGIKEQTTTLPKAKLLSRRSALLRFEASFKVSRPDQERTALEALRCAELARKEGADDGDIVLQEGLALWFLAHFAHSDSEYSKLLESAEERFWLSCERGNTIHALLTLARFFRQTYQPVACCDAFTYYLAAENQKRRAWRSSYIYGEAAVQLWYANYPRKFVEKHLSGTSQLLEEALDAGYTTARNIVDLAFVEACKGNREGADTVLRDIYTGETGISWQRAIEIAHEAFLEGQFSSDLLARGFALGIDDARVWNKLGTYAIDFLKDAELTEFLYREAFKLDRKNPIVLTNLARYLVKRGLPEDLAEAKRLLVKVSNYAEPRFTWWRAVRSMLEARIVREPKHAPLQRLHKVRGKARSVKDIRKWFYELKGLDNPQERGLQFEKLFNELMDITLGNARPDYRIANGHAPSPYYHQINGGVWLYFNKQYSRYETRWQEKKVSKDDIILFVEKKLDVVGVIGLFVSMSGFDEGAISWAKHFGESKCILLMDGEEVEDVIQGHILLDQLLIQKWVYYTEKSEPYHKTEREPLATQALF